MKILIVTGIFPPDPGGPATYVPRIAEALVARGHLIRLITLSDSVRHNDDIYPFSVIRLRRAQSGPRRFLKTIWTIARHAENVDLVFANGLFLESAVATRWEQRPLVMKIVGDWAWERSVTRKWTNDTIDAFQKARYPLSIEALKLLRITATRCADAVFTPSQYLGRIVEKWGVHPARLHVIYNALEPFDEVASVPISPVAGHTVVTVGRLVSWKGIDRLIRVVASLNDVRLIIVGEGPEKESLQRLTATLDCKERVIFTGLVPRQEVGNYLRNSDLFVLNSTYEGLPHIVLEAMSVGIPVIATNVGGTSEVVQHNVNGFLVNPCDDDALRSAMLRLLHSPEMRRQFVNVAHHTIEKHFQWPRLVESTETLLMNASRETDSQRR